MSALDWMCANQRVLVAEFARLKAQIQGEDATAELLKLEAARETISSPAAIDRLANVFQLSGFERDLLLLCAGVEMDAALAARCAELGGSNHSGVTFGLALATLNEPHWSAVTPEGPLRRWRLLDLQSDRTLTSTRLVLDERILHYLAGLNQMDSRLRPLLSLQESSTTLAPSHMRIVESVVSDLAADRGAGGAIHLTGQDTAGQQEVASRASRNLGLELHAIDARDIPPLALEAETVATLWNREATLLPAALLISAGDTNLGAARNLVQRISGLVFVASTDGKRFDSASRRYTVDTPPASEQRQLWVEALGPMAKTLNGSLDGIAAQYRMTSKAISQVTRSLEGTPDEEFERALWRTCRNTARSNLGEVTERVETKATWTDLVLPESQLVTLRQIAAHARQRLKVYEHWGFAGKSGRGLGVSALFTGESGTGKTMAAEVIANELQLDLYRVDLAVTVSKYIGETEKNLSRIFDAAENSGAVLLFDEADALFGKRSEVNDSRDRYANIEVSYLLQRMEAYRGLAILTTNLKNVLDPAFLRRLRFVVQFPFPDSQQRERIWRGAFPAEVPLAGVEHNKLAQLNVAGGGIRNIALNASFLAADEGSAVGMSHLLRAARSEAAKRDRPFSDAETRGWQ